MKNWPRILVNQDILKLIALVTMTIDHVSRLFFTVPELGNIGTWIGRTSFPIFAYLLMEHLYKRQIFMKYLKRLFSFGILSFAVMLPFQFVLAQNVAFPFNILITFAVAVLSIWVIEQISKENMPLFAKIFNAFWVLLILGALSTLTQYQLMGFLYLLSFYFYFKYQTFSCLVAVLFFSAFINPTPLEASISFLTTAFLLFVQHDKPYPRLLHRWWVFYAYYPAHLVVLASVAYLYMSCG